MDNVTKLQWKVNTVERTHHFNAPCNEILAIRTEFPPWRSAFYSRTQEISIRIPFHSFFFLSYPLPSRRTRRCKGKQTFLFKIFCLDAFLFLIHHRFLVYVMRFAREAPWKYENYTFVCISSLFRNRKDCSSFFTR